MASKAFTCSVSSAPLISYSSPSSSGVNALCFALRSVSFLAKKISQLVSHADDQVQRSSDEDMFNIIRRAMIASDERMSIQLKKLLNCSSIQRLIDIDRELSNSIMDGSGSIRERRFDSTTEKEFKVVYDISGEDASKLEVTILGDKLKIGFKPPEDKVEVLRRAIIRLFGTQITLPPRCETEKAKAVLKNGILVVRIPRKTID